MKKCSGCNQIKDKSNFYSNSSNKDGLMYKCKPCVNGMVKDWQEKNPEKVKKYKRRWNNKNKEYFDKWRKDNKEHLQNYYNNKIENDGQFKIKIKVGRDINKLIKRKNNNQQALEFLDCSWEFYKKWIEDQFEEGMTWDNYGHGKDKWCIDHIIPFNQFDLTNEYQYNVCTHYSNTQPLWWMDNRMKSDSVPNLFEGFELDFGSERYSMSFDEFLIKKEN